MKRAHFITFEGIEGSGKSTQIRTLERFYIDKGLNVFVTREPGGTELGNDLRTVLLHQTAKPIHPMTELLLMMAARSQHVVQVLQPAIDTHDLVLCDRFADSSLAYQGGGRKLDPEWIRQLNQQATFGLSPDLTVLLDLPPTESLQRVAHRNRSRAGSPIDRFEDEETAFHQRVREMYLSIARKEPGRVLVVQADAPPKEVRRIIVERIDSLLRRS